MKYKSEVFDKVQYLYEETKFNDHQLHSVIRFGSKLDVDVLRKSVMMLLQVIPILSTVYHHNNGHDFWKTIETSELEKAFLVAQDEKEFNSFTTSKINEFTEPQIKVCLYQSETDSLSIIMNHMICDAGGFKQCLYLLSSLYSNLVEDSTYLPDFKIDGDRSLKKVMSQIPFWSKLKSLTLQNNESNQDSDIVFPLSDDKNTYPFILTHEISPKKFSQIRAYCKENSVTINDVFLAAYYRALMQKATVEGPVFPLPIMVDMRRYLKDKSFNALSNLSSTSIVHIPVNIAKNFNDTVAIINRLMKVKKSKDIGLNGFVKLNSIFNLLNNKHSYKITKSGLKNPPICMTNIGIIDNKQLIFKGAKISSAFVCGSIKHRPHFQIAISSFADTLTISSNLYGSKYDYDLVSDFLTLVEAQLPV